MMTSSMISTAAQTDAELIGESLSGNRDAFGQIVSRYQSLICSLAYSATGNFTQSEDLAQETFVAAWKQLAQLREREKLRPWLCGIARNLINNWLRKQGREPSHHAEMLDEVSENHSPGPLPLDSTISKEEAALLWSSLEKMPLVYREPLVLFYREHQSIETVAAKLDLSEDAVKQRLSRGRKLLQEQILAFVEGALTRTTPGKTFTITVLASLPALSFSAKAATLGAVAAKGSASAKAAGAMGIFSALLGPLMIFFGNYLGYRIGMAEAHSDEERRRIKSFYVKSCLAALGVSVLVAAGILWVTRNQFYGWQLFTLLWVVFIVSYVLSLLALCVATGRQRHAYYSKVLSKDFGGVFPKSAFEYCSKTKFLGLPLVHIRVGDRFDFMRKPVKAWIAFGNYSIGGLFAFGGITIAPFSIGGLAIGLVPFGGLALGLIPLGGLVLGVWTFGGIAIGWQSLGCVAIAWNAASGNFALAHSFALGDIARALQMNNDIARQAMSNWFFRFIRIVDRHWIWMNVLWIAPLFVQWRLIVRSRRRERGNF